MNQALFIDYAHVGIIQFGYFAGGVPITFHLTLLPSFPRLLQDTASALVPYFVKATPRDRILTSRNTIALGGVLATLTDIPLLYPHGDPLDYTAAFAIEGTADVGNPVVLLTDVYTDGHVENEISNRASRVGLPPHRTVAVINANPKSSVEALFSLTKGLTWLVEAEVITPTMQAAIQTWQAGLSAS